MAVFTLLIASVVIVGLCLLAMAVGVIFRNRSFTSCGCSSINYRGERICCPACPDREEDDAAAGPGNAKGSSSAS